MGVEGIAITVCMFSEVFAEVVIVSYLGGFLIDELAEVICA